MAQATSRSVTFAVLREGGHVVDVQTSSPEVNHFLRVIKQSRSVNTWLGYANDLQVFFSVVDKAPAQVSRADCLTFMEWHDRRRLSRATINRRLAALSSLFDELTLLDPIVFRQNPVNPLGRQRRFARSSKSLYRKHAKRVPDIVPAQDIKDILAALRTWRDRAVIMLLWMSCLRISEALELCFDDIECGHRSVHIRQGKGALARTVYMDSLTFATLNRYLDLERRNAFPDEPHLFIALKGRACGKPLSVNAFQKLLTYHAEACGIAHLHAHRFRHTGITQLVQNGMSEPAVRAFVGHRSPMSLEPYLHLADSFVETEFARASNAFDLPNLLDSLSNGAAS